MKCKCEHEEEWHKQYKGDCTMFAGGYCDCKQFIPFETICGPIPKNKGCGKVKGTKICGHKVPVLIMPAASQEENNKKRIDNAPIYLCPSCSKLNTQLVENGSLSSPVSP